MIHTQGTHLITSLHTNKPGHLEAVQRGRELPWRVCFCYWRVGNSEWMMQLVSPAPAPLGGVFVIPEAAGVDCVQVVLTGVR